MVTEEQVWDALSNCFDPEIPVNIVDLGLIYDVRIDNNDVNIKMTFTTKGCPMHSQITNDVKSKILSLEGVSHVQVDVLWDPPWNQAMMSQDARAKLGLSE
jgi:metal-sulfur cluster biosynthetic enzyme